MDSIEFIRRETSPSEHPLLPGITLHLAQQLTALWEAVERHTRTHNPPPPFWAFAWAGGVALARYLLDHPDQVAGKRVLDFGSGSGVVAVAAARAGAQAVVAADIDPLAAAAQQLNAASNGVTIETVAEDLVGAPLPEFEVILAGDICYEQPMAKRVTEWLRDLAARGKTVLVGDPGRLYFPRPLVEPLAHFPVQTTTEVEDSAEKLTTVWRLVP